MVVVVLWDLIVLTNLIASATSVLFAVAHDSTLSSLADDVCGEVVAKPARTRKPSSAASALATGESPRQRARARLGPDEVKPADFSNQLTETN